MKTRVSFGANFEKCVLCPAPISKTTLWLTGIHSQMCSSPKIQLEVNVFFLRARSKLPVCLISRARCAPTIRRRRPSCPAHVYARHLHPTACAHSCMTLDVRFVRAVRSALNKYATLAHASERPRSMCRYTCMHERSASADQAASLLSMHGTMWFHARARRTRICRLRVLCVHMHIANCMHMP